MYVRTALLVSLLSTAALADNKDPKKSPAYDNIVLTQGAVGKLEKHLADTADWAKDKDARERARTAIQMVEPGLERIRKADPAWDLKGWDATLAKAKARLATADAALAHGEAAGKAADGLRYEFTSAASKVGDSLELLLTVETNPDKLMDQTTNAVATVLAGFAKVKSLDEACKAKNLATAPASGGKGTWRDPAVGCRVAASHRDLAGKYFELQVKRTVAQRVKSFEATATKARTGEPIDVAKHLDLLKPARVFDELKSSFEKAAGDFGFKVEQAWLEPLTPGAAGYAAALAEGAKTSRWDAKATFQDAQITAALAGDHSGAAGGLEKGQVLKAASFSDWSVEKDYRNQPVSRSRSVLALVKIDGESHCRVYQRTFEEKFSGSWSRPSGKGGATFQVSACK